MLLSQKQLCCACCLQALLLHDRVIKQAVYSNVGYVIEQEGDSFTVAFHAPEDAVAFTLQVRARRLYYQLQLSQLFIW